MDSIWNPGGIQVEIDKNMAGLPAKEIPHGLQVDSNESMWIPGGSTRNLWGSVKSSIFWMTVWKRKKVCTCMMMEFTTDPE